MGVSPTCQRVRLCRSGMSAAVAAVTAAQNHTEGKGRPGPCFDKLPPVAAAPCSWEPPPQNPPALHGEDVPYSRSPPPHSHTLIQVTVGKRVCWQIKEEVGRLKSSVLYLLVGGFFLMQLVLFVHLFPPGAPACIMLLIHLLSLSGAHRISDEVVTQVLAVNLASPGGWEPPSPP